MTTDEMTTDALAIFRAGVAAAEPYANTLAALREAGCHRARIVLAIGKAAVPMMNAAFDALGAAGIGEAILVTKYGHADTLRAPGCTVFECAHPIADENSERAADYVLQRTRGLAAADRCILLLSGGGSALFEKSLLDPAVQRAVTEKLLRGGADIQTLNCVRKRLSAVKGGKLARHTDPARWETFALSDVPGNRPDVIASGPTVADTSTVEDFWRIVREYRLDDIPATFVPDDSPVPPSRFTIVGDLSLMLTGAAREAEKRGYRVVTDKAFLCGEASGAALDTLRRADGLCGKTALLRGGETTVTVRGDGRGGRCQEAALAAAVALRGGQDTVFLAGGSDGTDGPTDAAGGIVHGGTYARIAAAGLNPERELANNNSNAALAAADALLQTGATRTNVNDLFLLLTDRKDAVQ